MTFPSIQSTKKRLDEFVRIRDKGIRKSRKIVSLSRSLIQKIHNRRKADKKSKGLPSIIESREKLVKEFQKVKHIIDKDQRLKHAGFWRNAMQELTEAITFHSIVSQLKNNEKIQLPDPKEIGVTDEAYLLGLTDLVGELKREVLLYAKLEKFKEAEKILSLINRLYENFMKFDYPHSVLPGFKKKQDISRRTSLSTRETLLKIEKESKLRKAIEKKEE